MRVFISPLVHQAIEEFYDYALLRHPALDQLTVMRKVDRLYDGIQSLSDFAHIYPSARYKHEWIDKDYQEFICEDFHFAYEIASDVNGEELVLVQDACHSFLYHN